MFCGSGKHNVSRYRYSSVRPAGYKHHSTQEKEEKVKQETDEREKLQTELERLQEELKRIRNTPTPST